MIRHKFYIGMMAVALLLPSCSQEEDVALPQGADDGAQTLTITTRTGSGQDDETTSTTETTINSFRLYLYDFATATKKEEHILTKDANGAWLEDGKKPVTALLPAIVNASVCDDPDQITFENYVLNGEMVGSGVTCNLPTDQTTEEKLEAAGSLMYALQAKLDKGEDLSLTFQHACSKLVFNVDKSEITQAGGVGKLDNIKINARYTSKYYQGVQTGWINWIQADDNGFDCFYNETDNTITAYIGYSKYAQKENKEENDVLMTLDVDGIPRNVRIKEDLEIIPGNKYVFTLDITPKEVTASVVANEGNDIPGWDESDETVL